MIIKLFLRVLFYFAGSLEDKNGKLSGRNITGFIFVALAVYAAFRNLHYGKQIDKEIWYSILVMILLLFAVVTWQQVQDFKNGKNEK